MIVMIYDMISAFPRRFFSAGDLQFLSQGRCTTHLAFGPSELESFLCFSGILTGTPFYSFSRSELAHALIYSMPGELYLQCYIICPVLILTFLYVHTYA